MLASRGGTSEQQPHPIDVHVGGRVRVRRVHLGLSQAKLAAALGLTFQQIQKYERGVNRISASKLFELSQFLEVPVSFFFEGVETGVKSKGERAGGKAGAPIKKFSSTDPDFMSRRETLQLISNYYRISDSNVRNEVLMLLKSLGRAKAS